MVNYKVQNAGNWKLDKPGQASGYFLYEIVETSTNQVIKTDMTQAEAKSLCRHMNFGGGFDGWTPEFFLAKHEKYVFWSEEDV